MSIKLLVDYFVTSIKHTEFLKTTNHKTNGEIINRLNTHLYTHTNSFLTILPKLIFYIFLQDGKKDGGEKYELNCQNNLNRKTLF